MSWRNGLYSAISTGSGSGYTMLLRIDLGGGGLGFASADLFRGTLAPSVTSMEGEEIAALDYVGSYRTPKLSVDISLIEKPILTMDNVHGGEQIKIILRPEPESDGLFELTGTGQNAPIGPVTLRAKYRFPEFHELKLQVDAVEGFRKPFSLLVDNRGQATTLLDCWRSAGYRLKGLGEINPALDQISWSLDQLRDFSRTKPGLNEPGFRQRRIHESLQLYLMVVGTQTGSSDTVGAMFDREDRASAAIFLQSLSSAIGLGNQDELDANYLWLTMHELGHCLNLPHAFEDKLNLQGATAGNLKNVTAENPTFMNYPQEYRGDGDSPIPLFANAGWNAGRTQEYKRFWSDFEWKFAKEELLALRHGSRRDVLVGGAPMKGQVNPYWGKWREAKLPVMLGSTEATGLELQIRVRSNRQIGGLTDKNSTAIFEYGEPVTIEARLENLIKRPREISKRLSILTGDLRMVYQTPNGSFYEYEPAATLCSFPVPLVLDGNPENATPYACYKDVTLNFSANGFGFAEPGTYRVRAAYRYGSSLLLSNVLDVYVRMPTREEETLLAPLLNDDVAEYFFYRGVSGLSNASDKLAGAFLNDDGSPRADILHPLLREYAAHEGRLSLAGRMFFDEARGQIKRTPPDSQRAAMFLRAALGYRETERSQRRRATPSGLTRFSNIAFGKHGRMLERALLDNGEKRSAKAWHNQMVRTLKQRSVPMPIITKVLSTNIELT